MADVKFSELPLLSAEDLDPDVDYLPIVDPSEPNLADRNKRVLATELIEAGARTAFNGRTNPLAHAVRVAMTAASSGSNGILTPNNIDANFGTLDFSIIVKNAWPDYSPTVDSALWYKREDASNLVLFYVRASGLLSLDVVVGGVAVINLVSTISIESVGYAAWNTLEFGVAVIRETAGSDGSVIFEVNGQQLGAAVPITAAATVSIDNAGPVYVNGTNAVRNESLTYSWVTYNRALTVAEFLHYSINGPALADMYGSQANLIPYPDDLTNAYWTKFQCTIDDDAVTGPDGVTPADVIIPDVGVNQADIRFTLPPVAGKKYRTSAKVKSLGYEEVVIGGFHFTPGANGGLFNLTLVTATPSSSAMSAKISALDDGWFLLVAESSTPFSTPPDFGFIGPVNFTAADGTSGLAVTDIKTEVLGITGHWSAEDCQGDTAQIFDRSGNGNHALLPASGATRIPAKREFEIRWTNTWAGTHELQYVGGTNQAIFPTGDIWIDSWTYKITGATIEDVVCGDGSDGDRFVTITTGLAAGTGRFTLASNTTDGTNLKGTIDPDANFTGSIASVIRGYILE